MEGGGQLRAPWASCSPVWACRLISETCPWCVSQGGESWLVCHLLHHVGELIDGLFYLEQDLFGVVGVRHTRFHGFQVALHHQIGLLCLLLDAVDHVRYLGTGGGGAIGQVRTSSATTAKPRPISPARAASMAALSASRLVCSRDIADGGDDLANLPCLLLEGVDGGGTFTHLHDHPLHAGGGGETYWLLCVVSWRTSLALCAARLQLSEMVVATCTICSLSWCSAQACAAVWRLFWLMAWTRLTEVYVLVDVLVVVHGGADHLLQLR